MASIFRQNHQDTVRNVSLKSFILFAMLLRRNSNTQRPRRPDRAVYVPRARRSQTTPPSPSNAVEPSSTPVQPDQSTNAATPTTKSSPSTTPPPSPLALSSVASAAVATLSPASAQLPPAIDCAPICDRTALPDSETDNNDGRQQRPPTTTATTTTDSSDNSSSDTDQRQRIMQRKNTVNNAPADAGLRIEDAVGRATTFANDKDDKDERELKRASKVRCVISVISFT